MSLSHPLRRGGVALVAACLVTNCGTRTSAPPPPRLSVDAGVDVRTHPRAPIVIDAHIRDAAAVRGPWRWTLTWGDRTADSGALEGGGSYVLGPPKANSEVRSTAHGVLALTLSDRIYHWQFLSVPREAFGDSGTAACHRGA
jgi:hypothetical protein